MGAHVKAAFERPLPGVMLRSENEVKRRLVYSQGSGPSSGSVQHKVGAGGAISHRPS